MSSLPPVGGTTRRSRLVAWTAPIASLPNGRVTAPVCNADRRRAFDAVGPGNRLPLRSLVARQSARINGLGKPDNRALVAAAMRVAA